jgi:mannose-6-phosphate isomerase
MEVKKVFEKALPKTSKEIAIGKIERKIKQLGLQIDRENCDMTRPWGAFWRIAPESTQSFVDTFFPGAATENISPKFLLVAPGAELSWQYHNRRSERWAVVNGPVGVYHGNNDEHPEGNDMTTLQSSGRIDLQAGERHALVGLKEWGLVAEIWEHTDAVNQSDENDIVRLQDKYGRGIKNIEDGENKRKNRLGEYGRRIGSRIDTLISKQIDSFIRRSR